MKTAIIIFLLSLPLFAQQYIEITEFGDFKSATAFSFSPQGFIFVADGETNEIHKIDTLGNEILSVGGYGWTAQTFDYPADIYAWTLRVFVADKNNNRIQILDKDLNFISEFNAEENESGSNMFAYPTCIATSNQGDYFILDSDNSRILKYDISGSFLLEIGNYDAGNFALDSPKKFAVMPGGGIIAVDNNGLTVFDQYGMGLNKINPGMKASNINITFNYAVINDSENIKILDLANPKRNLNPLKIESESPVVEGMVIKNKLYVLTENFVRIYRIENAGK